MIAIDTSAVIAIAFNEPEREQFLNQILSNDTVQIAAPTLVEIKIILKSRADERAAYFIEELLTSPPFIVMAFDETMAQMAARAYATFGKGSGHPAQLNYGDVFSYALAKAQGIPLLFKGDDFSKTDVLKLLKH